MNRSHTAESYLRLVERSARRAARHPAVGRFHRGFPGRDRRGFPGHARPDRGGGLRPGLFLQVFAASRHARGRARAGGRGGEGRAAAAPAGAASPASSGRCRRRWSAASSPCCSRSRAGCRADGAASPNYLHAVHVIGTPSPSRANCARVRITESAAQFAGRACWSDAPAREPSARNDRQLGALGHSHVQIPEDAFRIVRTAKCGQYRLQLVNVSEMRTMSGGLPAHAADCVFAKVLHRRRFLPPCPRFARSSAGGPSQGQRLVASCRS